MYGVAIVGLRLRDNVLKVRLLQPNTGKQSVSSVLFFFAERRRKKQKKAMITHQKCVILQKKK